VGGGGVLAGQLSIGWANDWVDYERDRSVGRLDKPTVAGTVRPSTLRVGAFVALGAAVPLSFASGFLAGLAHLGGVAFGWAYDLWLKSTVFSVVAYAGAFALLPTFVVLGLPGTPAPEWWVPVAGALLGAGAHFTNALPDLEADARAGVAGLPQRIGGGGSLAAAIVLLGAGSAVIAFAPAGRVRAAAAVAFVVSVALVGVVLVAAILGRRTWAFRLTILAALTLVGALVAAGNSLVA
jgi:4-hydroxybenzoate polyprenyltransferase